MEEPSRQNHHPTLTQASTAGRAGVDFGQFGAPQARRSPRNQKFADSPAEGTGFELPVAMNLVVAPASLGRVGAPFCQPILSGTQPKDTRSAIAVAGSLCRLPTLPKQTGAAKGRQPASLPPRTGSSNPVPSTEESANFQVREHRRPRRSIGQAHSHCHQRGSVGCLGCLRKPLCEVSAALERQQGNPKVRR